MSASAMRRSASLNSHRQEGRQRAIDAHEKTLDRLNTIIDGLEKEKPGTCQGKERAW